MAEIVTIEGQQYKKRNPLGVLGLTFITLRIYGLYWYYKINDEIRRFEKDETISPVRSLMAMLFGWIIIVPPFIAMYNTGQHIQRMEERTGIQQQISPALAVVLLLIISLLSGIYEQEHVNRVWEKATATGALGTPPMPAPPSP